MSFKERVKQKILICVVSEKSLLTPSFDRNCFFLIRKVKPPIFHFVWKMYAQILKEIACTEFKREYYHENCLRGLFWGDCNFITLNWNVYHIKHFTNMKREDYMYSKYIQRYVQKSGKSLPEKCPKTLRPLHPTRCRIIRHLFPAFFYFLFYLCWIWKGFVYGKLTTCEKQPSRFIRSEGAHGRALSTEGAPRGFEDLWPKKTTQPT